MNFYTSDQHFGHKNIIKYENRIFLTTEEMDAHMIACWNEVVGEMDVVYHLGDFSFGNQKYYLDRLNGTKILVKGNHDRKGNNALLNMGFEAVAQEFLIRDGKYRLLLSHRPQDRWKGQGEGIHHFYGHIHSNVYKNISYAYNVCVDVWNYYPKTAEQIIDGYE